MVMVSDARKVKERGNYCSSFSLGMSTEVGGIEIEKVEVEGRGRGGSFPFFCILWG